MLLLPVLHALLVRNNEPPNGIELNRNCYLGGGNCLNSISYYVAKLPLLSRSYKFFLKDNLPVSAKNKDPIKEVLSLISLFPVLCNKALTGYINSCLPVHSRNNLIQK